MSSKDLPSCPQRFQPQLHLRRRGGRGSPAPSLPAPRMQTSAREHATPVCASSSASIALRCPRRCFCLCAPLSGNIAPACKMWRLTTPSQSCGLAAARIRSTSLNRNPRRVPVPPSRRTNAKILIALRMPRNSISTGAQCEGSAGTFSDLHTDGQRKYDANARHKHA